MPKVKFNQSRTTSRAKPEDVETFEAGKTYEMSQESADRWTKRGAAEAVGDDEGDVSEPLRPNAKPEPKAKAAPRQAAPEPKAAAPAPAAHQGAAPAAGKAGGKAP